MKQEDVVAAIDGCLDIILELKQCKNAVLELFDLQRDIRSHLKHETRLSTTDNQTDVEYIYQRLCEAIDNVLK